MKRFATLVLVASLAITACQQTKDPDNQRAVGAVSGAILGAILGYAIGNGSGEAVMALLGAGVGSVGGYYAADEIIKRDKKNMQKAAYESLSSGVEGQIVYWENQETGSAGSFTVLRSYQTRDGRLCRDVSAWAMGDSQTTERRQTACRLTNGGWELI
jgi:surface antigen